MEFRLYIDEVGNGDLKGAATNPNVRFLSLTGILTRAKLHDLRIQPQLDFLKADLFGHTPAKPVILHRREIVRKEGVFEVLEDPVIHSKFTARMLQLFIDLPYLVITVVIDKKAHLETYGVWRFDPYHYCMRCLVERYVLYLSDHDWRGDVMIEARSATLDKKLKGSFQTIYKMGTENISARQVQNRLLSHDIKMKPKVANVAGLQLADLLCHPSARHMRFEREGLSQPDDFGTQVVDILLAKKYRRHPVTMKINGFGRKWLP